MAEAVRFKAAVERYLTLRKQRSKPNTYINDASLLGRFETFIGGNPWLSQVGPDYVEGFFYTGETDTKALNPTLADSSFNAARGRLSAFFKFCLRRGWISRDPMLEIRCRELPEIEQRRFTATELVHLYTSCRHAQERMLTAMAANTALRISDITKLRFGVWDPRRKEITDEPTVDLDRGWLNVYIHKTNKTDKLPITTELDAELRSWLTHYGESLGRPFDRDMLLIPSKVNGVFGTKAGTEFIYRPYSQISSPDTIYRRIVAEAGLGFTPGNGFHSLRRSFARLFYEELKAAGHADPIRPVSAMLHHQSPTMTYKYIGIQADRDARDVVLRGQPFLSRLAVDLSGVTRLPGASDGRAS